MKKYTQAEIKKFLEPETRFHMSAHVIQTEAVEMCRQLQKQLEKAFEMFEFIKEAGDGNTHFLAGKAIECVKNMSES